jgi:hypothetical protein
MHNIPRVSCGSIKALYSIRFSEAAWRNAEGALKAFGKIIAIVKSAPQRNLSNRKRWITAKKKLRLLKPYYGNVFENAKSRIVLEGAAKMLGCDKASSCKLCQRNILRIVFFDI